MCEQFEKEGKKIDLFELVTHSLCLSTAIVVYKSLAADMMNDSEQDRPSLIQEPANEKGA